MRSLADDIAVLPPPPAVVGAALSFDILQYVGSELAQILALPDDGPAAARLAASLSRLETALSDAAALEMREALLAATPGLRIFAHSLTKDPSRVDDLVQDTLLRAWARAESFERGTNLKAWLFTILRNLFYSEQRKRRREVEDADGARAARLVALPDQQARLDLADLSAALATLPAVQQEALLLIGAHGLSYDDAAEICGVAVGTVKSRVNRARSRLAALLGVSDVRDIGPDAATRAALVAR